MPTIKTHKGGPFYDWYVDAYGYAPPDEVNTDACRYVAWQHGWAKVLAQQIPYGTIGNCDLYKLAAAGTALSPTPPPAATPPPPTLADAGSALTAPQAPAQLAAAPPPPPPPVATATDVPTKTLPTVYGIAYDGTQLVVVNDVLAIGQSYKASRVVLEAAVYALMGESTIHDDSGGGWFQTACNLSAYNNGSDYKAQAHSFFNGGECFAKGAIAYSRDYNTAWQIANATEENKIWSLSRGDSYARDGYSTAMLTAEAAYAVSYFLGGNAPPYAPTTATSTPAPTAGGVFDLFKAINWAGDFINLWKYVVGGSNEAANMAKTYNENTLDKIDYINWPH